MSDIGTDIDNKATLMSKITAELNHRLSMLESTDKALALLYSETKKILADCQLSTKEIEKGIMINIAKIKETEEKKAKEKEKEKGRDSSTTKSTVGNKSQAALNTRNKTPAKSLTGNKSNLDNKSTVSKTKTPAKNLTSNGSNLATSNHNKSLSKLNTTNASMKGNISQRGATNLKASGTMNNLNSTTNRNKSKDIAKSSRNQESKNQLDTNNSSITTGKKQTHNTNNPTISKIPTKSNIQKVMKGGGNKDISPKGKEDTSPFTKVEAKIVSDNNEREKAEVEEQYLRVNDNKVSVNNISNLIGAVDSSQFESELIMNQNNSGFIKLDETVNTQSIVKAAEKKENLTNSSLNKENKSQVISKNINGILKYLTLRDSLNAFQSNKAYLRKVYEYYLSYIDSLQNQLKNKYDEIRQKFTDKDLNKEIEPFKFTKGTEKAIELLNEPMYYKFFQEEKVPVDDYLIPFKLFLQIINFKDAQPVYCQSNSHIWKCIYNLFKSSTENNSGSIMSSLLTKEMDLSVKNIYEIMRVLGSNSYKITPNYYSKSCGTTGLVVFFVKDVLDYLGITYDRKTIAKRAGKTFEDLIEYFGSLKDRIRNKYNKLSLD